MSNNNIFNLMGNPTSPLSSTYFEDLLSKITKLAQCGDCGELDTRGFGDCLSQISLLGERAKKMLQVGALQDELIKLGFKLSQSSDMWGGHYALYACLDTDEFDYNVEFLEGRILISAYYMGDAEGDDVEECYWEDSDWRYTESYCERALNKVRELLGVGRDE